MSTPSLTIPDYYPTHFGVNWQHLVQQKVSRLRQYVEIDTDVQGYRKSYNQIGISEMEKITTRLGETTDMDRLDEKRWVSLEPYHATKWFDEWDAALLGNIILPTNETVRSQAMAAGRTMDDIIITAVSGDALTGELGTTTTALPSSQKVAVSVGGADSNMNLEKLLAAKALFATNEVVGQDMDGETLVLAMGQSQINALLRTTEVTSADFNVVKALVRGEVNTFMGFEIVRTERLPIDANNVRSCYAWVRSGVKLALGQDFMTRMDILPMRSHALQIRSTMRAGATRMEEEKVVEIACDED